MILEKNKVYHLFYGEIDSTNWTTKASEFIHNILSQEGWKEDDNGFFMYPQDNRIRIKYNLTEAASYDRCIGCTLRSYSNEGIYQEFKGSYCSILSMNNSFPAGVFFNYIKNSKGEVGLGISSNVSGGNTDCFQFLIGIDQQNNAGVFVFDQKISSYSDSPGDQSYSFFSLGQRIDSYDGGGSSYNFHTYYSLDAMIPYSYSYANTILYNCINFISGSFFDNVYGFYSTSYNNGTLCSSVLSINKEYYKPIGNPSRVSWTNFNDSGNPTSEPITNPGASFTKCLKLI